MIIYIYLGYMQYRWFVCDSQNIGGIICDTQNIGWIVGDTEDGDIANRPYILYLED